MTYSYYWIEGSNAKDWIYATTKKRARELFFDKHGEQEIYYIGKDVMD